MVEICQDVCTGCGMCVKDCVSGVLSLRDGKAAVKGTCLQCGHCVAVCPVGAPAIPEYDMADVEPAGAGTGLDARTLLHTIKMRRSIRQYRQRPVEREKLEAMVQAGRYTATAVNYQDSCFIVVRDGLEEFKSLIWEGIGKALALPREEAPEHIGLFRRFYNRYKQDKSDDFLFRNAPALIFIASGRSLDAGLAAQNMELTAVAKGLGVLYNGYLARAAAQIPGAARWLSAQDKQIAVCMLVGYPAVQYARSAPRRAADALWK